MSFRAKLLTSHIALAIAVLVIAHLLGAGSPITTSALALLVAAGLGLLVSSVAMRPVRRMTERSLAHLAGRLEERIGQLSAERDRLSEMLEQMVEGVIVIDRTGRVSIANPAASRILASGAPLAGRTVAETIRHPAARAAITAALTAAEPSEIEVESPGPERRVALVSVRPLSTRGGGGGGAVAVLHDLTRIRQLETTRRDFVTNVSHELRTPVASIQASAETLLDGGLEDHQHARHFVHVIHRNARRLGRLVSDLLSLSRLEARTTAQIRSEPVALADAIAQVVDTVRQQANARAMTVLADVPLDARALADPDGVEQMLVNLVDNAIKYGREGGKIRIAVARSERWIDLSVADDGPGIEDRHHARLFERFYRIDEGRATAQGGSGLGLAIVSHLARSMGGTVSVTSEVGVGSRFTIRLPSATGA